MSRARPLKGPRGAFGLRRANEEDENARRLKTNVETMCNNEANELKEVDPESALREAAAAWIQLWRKVCE